MGKKQPLPYREVGARLGVARKMLGLSQKQFAQKSLVSYGSISAYERGVNLPKLDAIEKIAATGINMTYVLDGTGAPLKQPDVPLTWASQKENTPYTLQENKPSYTLPAATAIDNPSAYLASRKRAYNDIEEILQRIDFTQAHKLLVGTMAELVDRKEISLKAAEMLLVIYRDEQEWHLAQLKEERKSKS